MSDPNGGEPAADAGDTAAPPPMSQTLPETGQRYGNAAAIPRAIGPYHILDILGRGGMGEIYKAERRSPYRQIVALKLIKLGYDSREVIARFDSERQALARMDHPNIAKVLDAGVSETGRPYFVMEYVPGVPVTRFADENKLAVRQRLELFKQICDAIAHAHIKQVIHRDIKAANVLAYMKEGTATVKVIDFGIAKALTSDRLTEATFNTMGGQVIGTYSTMSPEQAGAAPDIDTRTDVYSLGVLLYELLAGAEPFDPKTLAKAAEEEIRRIIREEEPPRPSTRLTAQGDRSEKIAEARQTHLVDLQRMLLNELDWIPLKAMRKERDRRYSSAGQLAEDIDNYLNNRPLIAAPESRIYRFKKYARRNRAALIAVACVMLALILGFAGTTVGFLGQRRLRVEAEQSAAVAQTEQHKAEDANAAATQINQFLTDMLSSVGASGPARKPVLVRDALDNAANEIATRFHDQPLVEASVELVIGRAYTRLTLNQKAELHLKRSLEIRRQFLGDNNLDTIEAVDALATAFGYDGNSADEEPLSRESAGGFRKLLGEDDPMTINAVLRVATLLQYDHHSAEADSMLSPELGRCRRVLGANDQWLLDDVSLELGTVLGTEGKSAEAESLIREVVQRQDVRGNWRWEPEAGLADLLFSEGKVAEAEPLCRNLVAWGQGNLGNDHAFTIWRTQSLAMDLLAEGKYSEAEPLLRDLLARHRRDFGERDYNTYVLAKNLTDCLLGLGKLSEAQSLARDEVALWEQQKARYPLNLAQMEKCLAEVLQAENQLPGALSMFEQAYRDYRESGAANITNDQTGNFAGDYGLCLAALGRHAEARQPLELSRQMLMSAGLSHDAELRKVLAALVQGADADGQSSDAAQLRAELAAANGPSTQPIASSVLTQAWLAERFGRQSNQQWTVPPTATQPTSPQGIISFWFDYPIDNPGRRRWVLLADGRWTETYADGFQQFFVDGSAITVEGDPGQAMHLGSDPSYQVFIPDRGAKLMWVRFRQGTGDWSSIAPMQDVK